jgi:hypothetical protein
MEQSRTIAGLEEVLTGFAEIISSSGERQIRFVLRIGF